MPIWRCKIPVAPFATCGRGRVVVPTTIMRRATGANAREAAGNMTVTTRKAASEAIHRDQQDLMGETGRVTKGECVFWGLVPIFG